MGGEDAPKETISSSSIFVPPEDSRDRFASEKAFYTHAQSKVPGKIPQVQGWDPEGEAGLFVWVEGRKLTEPEVTGARIQEALEFFTALNRLPLPNLSDLPFCGGSGLDGM